MCQHKPTDNLTNFSTKSSLGQLMAQAKVYNQINTQLHLQLPDTLKDLELCLIKDKVATLMTSNSAVAFRAKQQINEIFTILQGISSSQQINHVEIKVYTNK